jgi:type VI secretion system secreted protein VgrG
MTQAHAEGARGPAAGSADIVRYTFSCEEVAEQYSVVAFDAVEELNRPYRVTLWLQAVEEHPDSFDLLRKSACLGIERGEQRRQLAGVVSRVEIVEDGGIRQTCAVELVPALATLGLGRNTRIFQDKSALEIVTTVLGEGLDRHGRELDFRSVRRDGYLVRDYCVQYQESDLDFVHRLMEEEGIGYHFVHGDRERMVLFDDNRHFATVHTLDEGPVRFDPLHRAVGGLEPIVRFKPAAKVAPTGLAVRDHDWTQGRPTLEQTAGDGPDGQVYEHGFGRGVTISEEDELIATLVSTLERSLISTVVPTPFQPVVRDLFGAPVADFTRDDTSFQARIRHELLRRDTRTAGGSGLVTGFSAGLRFSLVNHPTLGADGDYYLVRVRHSSRPDLLEVRPGEAPEIGGANYVNQFECIPLDVPWRPARVTRKPRIYGVQTATVTGPMGMDVYTDQHGRVKVRFPWDRRGDDLTGAYSCWLRVGQVWAGTGQPGFMFVPRVGMEVIVSFVDGDPDRPLVTGCVYNGRNHPPDLMPVRATKSIIRTRTVPHSLGYNELSFEDMMGMEEIYLRAERNLREEVRLNHISTVGNLQLVEVRGDQVGQVGGSQRLFVQGDQAHVVHGAHTCFAETYKVNVLGTMNTRVGHSQTVTVESGSRSVNVEEGEHALTSGGRFVISQGGENHVVLHTSTEQGNKKGIHVKTPNAVMVEAGDAKMTLNEDGAGAIRIESTTKIELVVGDSKIEITPDKIRVNKKTYPA